MKFEFENEDTNSSFAFSFAFSFEMNLSILSYLYTSGNIFIYSGKLCTKLNNLFFS